MSAAASFVSGTSVNGKGAWKVNPSIEKPGNKVNVVAPKPKEEVVKIDSTDQMNKKLAREMYERIGHSFAPAYSYGKLQIKKYTSFFWLNTKPTFVDMDWDIVLNDQTDREVILLHIPAGFLHIGRDSSGSGLKCRPDNGLTDLCIGKEDLIEINSKVDFSQFLVKKLSY